MLRKLPVEQEHGRPLLFPGERHCETLLPFSFKWQLNIAHAFMPGTFPFESLPAGTIFPTPISIATLRWLNVCSGGARAPAKAFSQICRRTSRQRISSTLSPCHSRGGLQHHRADSLLQTRDLQRSVARSGWPYLVAARDNPILRQFYLRLRAAGKPAKLALTTTMRKLLIVLNSSLKSDLIYA